MLNGDQLKIEVEPAPRAIGRFTIEHELAAYREALGDDALERQKKLALQAKECTCGEQEKADKKAVDDRLRPKKLFGHQHKPGCNSYTRSQPKLTPRISQAEQQARYEEERRVDQLRDALAQMRADEGETC